MQLPKQKGHFPDFWKVFCTYRMSHIAEDIENPCQFLCFQKRGVQGALESCGLRFTVLFSYYVDNGPLTRGLMGLHGHIGRI